MRIYSIIMISFFMSISFALTSEVDDNSMTVSIGNSENVPISFQSEINDTIILSLTGGKPWMLLSDSKIKISENSAKTVSLLISPKSGAISGLYKVTVTGQSFETGEKFRNAIFISVIKQQGIYIERIIVKGDLQPTGKAEINFEIKNFEDVSAQNILFKTAVEGPEGILSQKEKTIDTIDPNEIKKIIEEILLPENLASGEYFIKSEINGTRSEQKFVIESTAIIDEKIDTINLPFGNGKRISFRNLGNENGVYKFEEIISKFDSLFFDGNPNNVNGEIYIWSGKLEPGKSIVIEYKINYFPLILFAIILIIAFWVVTKKIRSVRIKKFVMQKKMIKQGSEFTVGLEIKNSSGAEVSDIIVKDFAPAVFKVKDSQGVKSEKKKSSHGTTLTWNIDKFKNGEERLFSYKIIPILGVSGKMNIPAATVNYRQENNFLKNKSSSPSLGVFKRNRYFKS